MFLLVLATGSRIGPPAVAGPVNPVVSAADAAFFESKVRPVLVARCQGCHGAGSSPAQAGLRLDSRAGLIAGGKRGPALVAGDPDSSLLIRTIRASSGVPRMPPDGKISRAEVEALAAWVKLGAPWPTPAVRVPAPQTSSVAHWAWQPPLLPRLPRVRNQNWVSSPIDRFILAGLEAANLTPAPPADRRTLIRRATFDLTGLPPTPAEVAEFLADTRPDAFSRVLDRLLASPAYGERWGRHWLDVARYADSNGVDENLAYVNAWRYRDYVVRAFNQGRPIDRFIREQIAGDLLEDPPGDEGDGVVATGFLSLGPKMLAEDDPVKQEEDIIDEQIDTLGRAFMGVTLGCSRCHDHKFDPFPQTDYYSLAGIFKSTRTMLNFKTLAEWQELPVAGKEDREKIAGIDRQVQAVQSQLRTVREQATAAVLREATRRRSEYLRVARTLADKPQGGLLLPAGAGGAAPVGSITLEAEEYTSGNVLKDRDNYGRGIGVLVNAGQYPNFAEYPVEIGAGGEWQLDLRYASGDPRPVRILVNDRLVSTEAAGGTTGGFFPQHQRWAAAVVVRLPAGPNRIRLERDSFFPHIDRLLLSPYPGSMPPRTRQQSATEAGLVPELLGQAEEQLRTSAGRATEIEFTSATGLERAFAPPDREAIRRLEAEIASLEKSRPPVPRAMAVSDGKPVTMRVHIRGDYQSLGADCPRSFPAVLNRQGTDPIPPDSSGRLQLARWITRPDHPLTARVFVNRVWRWLLGRGLVPSTDNFGTLGDKPINQPLLDWLAVTFVRNGWSLKRLQKDIMLSATYRMSSRYDSVAAARDPDNRLHWRHSRRRLEAEAIRDSILAVSGRLDRTVGGSLLRIGAREYVTSTANKDPISYQSSRRSLYLPVIRSALYEFFTAFDFGDPTVLNGDRASTTVAPQALFVMNSPIVQEESRALATALCADPSLNGTGRARRIYQLCFAREPTAVEVRRALELVARVAQADPLKAETPEMRELRSWQSLVRAMFATTEFTHLD